MKLILCHLPGDPLGENWTRAFAGCDVEIHSGNILDIKADAIVSPANSFGFMNGGIDLAYSHFFGWGVQARLQEVIKNRPLGELLIGESLVVPTENPTIPWMIAAPTMRVPYRIDNTINAYLAMKAILLAAKAHDFKTVSVPGLGTGTGFLPADIAAVQMRVAYDEIINGFGEFPASLTVAGTKQWQMNPTSLPAQFQPPANSNIPE